MSVFSSDYTESILSKYQAKNKLQDFERVLAHAKLSLNKRHSSKYQENVSLRNELKDLNTSLNKFIDVIQEFRTKKHGAITSRFANQSDMASQLRAREAQITNYTRVNDTLDHELYTLKHRANQVTSTESAPTYLS